MMSNHTSIAASRLEKPLFFMRLGIFVVFLMWSLDKFVNTDRAIGIFGHFYGVEGLSTVLVYLVGAAQLALVVAFGLGVKKTLTYGAILGLHLISTLVSYNNYLHAYDGKNLLFFAAFPMLAACWALFTLREFDTKYTLSK